MGKLEEAHSSCKDALKATQGTADRDGILKLRGRISRHLGNYEDAIKDYQDAYTLDHDPSLYLITEMSKIYVKVFFSFRDFSNPDTIQGVCYANKLAIQVLQYARSKVLRFD